MTPRIHSSFDPSCRLMRICPGGTLTGVGGWSSPDLAGFLLVAEWRCRVVSQSIWMDWMRLSIWNSPSTVPMTATCRWASVHGGIGSCLGISVGCGLWVVPPRCSLKSRRLVGLFPWLLVILGSMSFFSMSWRSRSESNGLSPAWLPRFLPLNGNIPGRGSRS